MASRFEKYILDIRGPEVLAAAIGYVAGSFGFEFTTSKPYPNEAELHNVEGTLIGIGTAVTSAGLAMAVRKIRSDRNEPIDNA